MGTTRLQAKDEARKAYHVYIEGLIRKAEQSLPKGVKREAQVRDLKRIVTAEVKKSGEKIKNFIKRLDNIIGEEGISPHGRPLGPMNDLRRTWKQLKLQRNEMSRLYDLRRKGKSVPNLEEKAAEFLEMENKFYHTFKDVLKSKVEWAPDADLMKKLSLENPKLGKAELEAKAKKNCCGRKRKVCLTHGAVI